MLIENKLYIDYFPEQNQYIYLLTGNSIPEMTNFTSINSHGNVDNAFFMGYVHPNFDL